MSNVLFWSFSWFWNQLCFLFFFDFSCWLTISLPIVQVTYAEFLIWAMLSLEETIFFFVYDYRVCSLNCRLPTLPVAIITLNCLCMFIYRFKVPKFTYQFRWKIIDRQLFNLYVSLVATKLIYEWEEV